MYVLLFPALYNTLNKYTILYYFTYFHVRNGVMEQNSLMRDILHLPLLLMFVDRYNVTLIIGRILTSSIVKDKLAEAFQAYMGLYYLLDIDYPMNLS